MNANRTPYGYDLYSTLVTLLRAVVKDPREKQRSANQSSNDFSSSRPDSPIHSRIDANKTPNARHTEPMPCGCH